MTKINEINRKDFPLIYEIEQTKEMFVAYSKADMIRSLSIHNLRLGTEFIIVQTNITPGI